MTKKETTQRIMDVERGTTNGGQVFAAVTAQGPAVATSPPPTDLSVIGNVLALSAQTPMARISLQWRRPLSSQEVRLYQIQVATDAGFTTGIIYYNASDTTISIDVVTNTSGITYYFRVRVLSGGIVSDWSGSVSAVSIADTTPAGLPTSLAANWTNGDLILTWTNPTNANLKDVEVRIWNDSGKSVLYHTGYSAIGRYVWTLPQQRIDTSGSLDAAVYVELRSRTWSNVLGTSTAGISPTNAAPSAPSAVSVISSIGTLTISVTATLPSDFFAFRYRLIQTSPSASDVTWDSPSALESYSLYAQATYQVGVKVLDVYGQLSSETLSSTSVIDTLTIGSLRAEVIYSDADSNSDATLHTKLSDGVLTSGGQTYSTTATWNKWVRAERPTLDRYRTITLSMTPASGTSSWYVRLSSDGTTWTYYAGPVTSSRILTSVVDASAAQAAAVSAATLGGQTTSRVELPANVEARFVEVWIRNAGPANTRLDEFYPRRVVEADDIKVQNLSGISADLGSITAGTVTGATIQTATGNPRAVLDSTGLTTYDSGGTVQVTATTSTNGALTAGGGQVTLNSAGLQLLATSSFTAANSVSWLNAGSIVGSVSVQRSSGLDVLRLRADADVTTTGSASISGAGKNGAATSTLTVRGNDGSAASYIELISESIVITGTLSGATFTPALAGSGTAGTFTYTTRTGRYRQIGNQVIGSIQITISAIGTPPTGDLRITGLPVTSAAVAYSGHVTIGFLSQITLLTGTRFVGGTVGNGATYLNLTESPSAGNASNIPASAVGATANIVIGFMYEV